MSSYSLISSLEAILFANGEPISEKSLQEILEVDLETLNFLLISLKKRFEQSESSLQLQNIASGWQITTKAEFFPLIKKLTHIKERKLSNAALETLAVIAFKQPITKAEIEIIRGVHIEKTLSRLLDLDLVVEKGRKPVLGRPVLYGTTVTFLRHFGLKSLDQLKELFNSSIGNFPPEQISLIK